MYTGAWNKGSVFASRRRMDNLGFVFRTPNKVMGCKLSQHTTQLVNFFNQLLQFEPANEQVPATSHSEFQTPLGLNSSSSTDWYG